MAEALQRCIGNYFIGTKRLSKQKLVGSIKQDFPEWSDNTINMYLSRLKKEKIINTPSRGVYGLDSNALFSPCISNELKRIFSKIKRVFPYITFCVWDTVWLNALMRHQPFKHYMVIEVEKDASEPVFRFLSETMRNVFLNPDDRTFDLYINGLDNALIVKNLISEAPLTEEQRIVIPTLEKLLVDMLIDTALYSAQQNEKEFIMHGAIEKFTLNELKMRRYAIRRNKEREIHKLLNISLAK